LSAKTPERLSELSHVVLVQNRPAALDNESRHIAIDLVRDVDKSVSVVVAHGVLDHVLDHPREQQFTACQANRGEGCLHLDLLLGDRLTASCERSGDDPLDRDRALVGERAVLCACEHEEAVEQPVGVIETVAEFCVERV
jgi:hypothetical protein